MSDLQDKVAEFCVVGMKYMAINNYIKIYSAFYKIRIPRSDFIENN